MTTMVTKDFFLPPPASDQEFDDVGYIEFYVTRYKLYISEMYVRTVHFRNVQYSVLAI